MRAAIVAAVLAAACASPDASRPTTHTVVIEGFAYTPAVDTIHVGDTVRWINRDIVPHNATMQDGTWESGDIADTGGALFVASRTGEVPYLCSYHPTMKGALVVE